MISPEYDFYELVTVVENPTTRSLGISGAEGAIIGMSQDEDTGAYRYVIGIDNEEAIMLDPEDLAKTGRHGRREDFYDGSRMGVSPEGEVRWRTEPGEEPPPVVGG